jgi:hypothetical protein
MKMSQTITSYPGHEITPEDVKEGKYLDVVYKFEPKYSWAAGVAISRFLAELKSASGPPTNGSRSKTPGPSTLTPYHTLELTRDG